MTNPLEQLSLTDLRRRTSAKWQWYGPDVLPLWVAEMDVPLAEPIAQALREAIATGDTGYPTGTGFAEALDEFARKRWGWDGVVADRTAIVADVMQGAVEVLKILTGPGDPVVVNCPVYPPFYSFVGHMNREIIEAPLSPAGRIDLATLELAFQQAVSGPSTLSLPHGRRAAYLLCSPHNPTGTVHTADELAAVAALADQYGIRVVVDEIHAQLVLPGATFVPYLSVPGTEAAFSLMSSSKAWNLSGLKAALIIAGSGATEDLARIPEEVSHGPSHLGVIAHAAALRDGGEWLDGLLAGLDHNRRLLAELLAEHLPAVRYRLPEATFLAWLDCRELGLPDEPPAEPGIVTLNSGPAAVFLERGKVAVNAGQAFGTGGAGHVRLNFATSAEILTEAVRRMAAALRD